MLKYNFPTEDSALVSSTHGRCRREKRGITKSELQSAKQYGMKEDGHSGRVKYTYGGIVFIYDPRTKKEVTSYRSQDISSDSSGTKCTKPITLEKAVCDLKHVGSCNFNVKKVTTAKEEWTSHSVIVVDMSGSMRRDDVNGARCRSDGVWLSLARDLIKAPLDNGTRAATDFISVVLMSGEAKCVIRCQPTDWVLYNKFIDMREWSMERPEGPGNYMPALKMADSLLMLNTCGSCSLSLLFFSDGRPSDLGDFAGTMGAIAAKFGRRLACTCIGMADQDEDFSTLQAMVRKAKSLGAIASFRKPSLDVDSLSDIVTSVASTLTSARTEIRELGGKQARTVRVDVTREEHGAPDDEFLTSDWQTYEVLGFWSWCNKRNNFAKVFDWKCECCRADCRLSRDDMICPDCQAVCYCSEVCRQAISSDHKAKCEALASDLHKGMIVHKEIHSFKVAIRQTIFGEGAERMVHKLRYLNEQAESPGHFTGPLMVAKESRFIEEEARYDRSKRRPATLEYHRSFMMTQGIASEMAARFNAALEELKQSVGPGHPEFPRISFLEPMVVKVRDGKLGEYGILIEPMLEVARYEKFNNNMGYVKGQSKVDSLGISLGCLGLGERANRIVGKPLGGIEEVEEDEDEDEDDEDAYEDDEDDCTKDLVDKQQKLPCNLDLASGTFLWNDSDVPHAFSHFTYVRTTGKLMVVDLQGVFEQLPDGSKCFQLTDPVVHKKKSRKLKKWNFGRTNLGRRGMVAFFATHKCTDLCRMLGLRGGIDLR
jgi:hypothetical protein